MFAGIHSANATLTFTLLDLNGNYKLSSSANIAGFPLSESTYLGGVPFKQSDFQGQVWNAAYLADGSTQSTGNQILTLNTNVADARGFYSVINTWWGAPGPSSYASVTFNFSDSSTFTKDLVGNLDIRDFNYQTLTFTNQINNTTTRNVYLNEQSSYALDRQWIDFGPYSGKTLTSVVFTDSGDWALQRFLLSGATVQSGESGQIVGPALLPGQTGTPGVPATSAVPEPGSNLALLALGAGGLTLRRRLKRAA